MRRALLSDAEWMAHMERQQERIVRLLLAGVIVACILMVVA